MDITKNISNVIKEQFPDFYKEEGEMLIEFVTQYYKWMEQENNPLYHSRNLFDYNDIDNTFDEFLDYFVKKYMSGIPTYVFSDKRLLQKNILDLYRAKGSNEGFKLLFRFLYNEEIDIYVPQVDVFKPSAGRWIEERYIEVEDVITNDEYPEKMIRGSISGATALVESYQRRTIKSKINHLLFISNIRGDFIPGEALVAEGMTNNVYTSVVGSVIGVNITEGFINNNVGDTFIAQTGTGSYMSVIVSETRALRDVITFNLVDGGEGYSNDAVITISTGSNTAGSGAAFVIDSLIDTSIFKFNNVLVKDYANVAVNAANYSYGVGDTSPLATANLSTILDTAILYTDITVGSIGSIRTTNPGLGYNGFVNVNVRDPYTVSQGISGGSGIWGNNAIITGSASTGAGVVSFVRINDSGIGYRSSNNSITLINPINNHVIVGELVFGGIGKQAGYWEGTQSFPNSDKYIQDSDFYQEYSYEIRSSKTLDTYRDIVKRILHPGGNMMFANVILSGRRNDEISIVTSNVVQT